MYGWDAQNAWRTCQGPNPSPTQANSPIDLSYNALGRMSAYANADANTSAVYTYDAAGQRTKSTVTVGSTTTTTDYAYDGLTLMKLSATQSATTWRIDYLYDEEGAVWGGVYRTSSATTYFSLIASDRGDVVELCDADGAPFAAYRYDAWGLPQGAGTYATGIWTQGTTLVNATLACQIASRQVLRYASYAWDTESAYQYCAGDPVGQTDESGLGTRQFLWPTYSDQWMCSRYLKWVLRTDAGWLRHYRRINHFWDAWDKGKELSQGGGDWDFNLMNASTRVYFHTPIKGRTYETDVVYSDYWYLFQGRKVRHWTSQHRECTYGTRWISDEDFGNIHFGYIVASLGRGFWIARNISWADAFDKNRLNCNRERRNEAHDQAMIKWGHELYDKWGSRTDPADRYSR